MAYIRNHLTHTFYYFSAHFFPSEPPLTHPQISLIRSFEAETTSINFIISSPKLEMAYITPQGQSAIRRFKYKGGNLAYSYNYLWGPLAEQLIKITPQTWAPNSITVVGFIINAIGTMILLMQGAYGDASSCWALIQFGIMVFLYQTLDNVDGKQARKLGNSTPLGMIMDHGCDGLGLIFLVSGLGKVMWIGDLELLLGVFTIVTFGFYLSTWSLYYSDGMMILGKINAVEDGIPLIWIFAFSSALFGQEFWTTELSFFGYNILLNEFASKFFACCGFLQVKSIISEAGDKFTHNVLQAAKDLYHLPLIGGSVYCIIYHSDLCNQYITPMLVGVAITMSRSISYTLLCSVAEMKIQQFHPSVLVFGLGYPILIFFGQALPTGICIYAITAFIVAEYTYFVVSVCNHIARALNIKVFQVFDPKQIKRQ